MEQEENEDDGRDATLDQDAGPSSGAAPNGPASSKPASQEAQQKTPKQGQEAENGAAGEGRVQGTGKRGGLTETEGRSTGLVQKILGTPSILYTLLPPIFDPCLCSFMVIMSLDA